MTERSHISVPVEKLKALIEAHFDMQHAVTNLVAHIADLPGSEDLLAQLNVAPDPPTERSAPTTTIDPDAPPAHLAAHDLLAERHHAWGGITIDQWGTHYVTVPDDGPEAA
jgi:hypothetical protein